MLRRPRLVDHVDRLVGQLAVVDVARGQFHRRFDRVSGVFDVVMVLEIGLETLEDFHRVFHRRLVHVDLLEPARQCAVLFEVLAELLVGGGAHGAQLAALQGRFQQVGGIHRPAGGGARADHRVDLVDEQHRVGMFFQLVDHGFQPLFEIAAIAGARQQGAHVQRIDRGLGQHLGGVAVDDLARQTFRDGGLADAGVTHQQRIVLATAAQHLNAAFHLGMAPDQRIHVALAGLRVQIDAIFGQSRFLVVGGLCGLGFRFFLRLLRAGDRAALAIGGVLGHAMRDEIDRVVAGHVLLLQEIGGIAFAFGKDGDQHVGPRHLGPAGALHMDGGALDHPLEGGGRHGFRALDIGDEVRQIFVDEFHQRGAQFLGVDGTGLHDTGGVGLVHQCQQQVFEGREFVAARVGQRQRRMDCLLQSVRE